jgi:hypothetical protein
MSILNVLNIAGPPNARPATPKRPTYKVYTYEVTYIKAIEEDAVIMVRANDADQALRRAALHCYTGSNFRNPVKTNKQYISPTLQR